MLSVLLHKYSFVGEMSGNFKDVEDEHLEREIEPLKASRRPNSVVIPEVGAQPDLLEPDEAPGCNCERPLASLRCEGRCGLTLRGRLSLPCPAHPGRRHLMDHQPVCPQCGQLLGKLLSHKKVQSNLHSTFFYFQIF